MMSSSVIHRFRVLPYSQSNNYTIIYLFLTVLLAQMVVISLLLFKTRFRKPLIVWLDGLKRGRAQLVVKSVSATVLSVTIYSIYRVVEIRICSVNVINSINHIILAFHTLQAFLMGFSLFLLLTIDYLHKYMRELITVTEAIRDLRKENRAYEESTKKSAVEVKEIRKEISRLKTEITNLESEYNIKEQAVQIEKINSNALTNKLQGLVEEYYRLLACNKDLGDQLQDINKLFHSSSKKSVLFSWGQWGL